MKSGMGELKGKVKTKGQLIEELEDMPPRVAELKKPEALRKQTKGALSKSEDRYQALFDRSLDCLYVVDLEGRFIDANPAALSLLGYERADIPFLNISGAMNSSSCFLNKETPRLPSRLPRRLSRLSGRPLFLRNTL